MRVLIAGTTGAIGKPLLSCLDVAGHELLRWFAPAKPPAHARRHEPMM